VEGLHPAEESGESPRVPKAMTQYNRRRQLNSWRRKIFQKDFAKKVIYSGEVLLQNDRLCMGQ